MPPVHSVVARQEGENIVCSYGKCNFTSSKSNVIFHEVEDHIRKKFFCHICDKILASFESLRTHANSQHFRARQFKCETCTTVYLDPARLAKCRKRHRGMHKCTYIGCSYHNARLNSVIKHIRTTHPNLNIEIHFDQTLGTRDPPKARRPHNSAAQLSKPRIAGLSTTDDELFKKSEEKRKEMMATVQTEHEIWAGKGLLTFLVPKYPVYQPRDHPYGRPTPPSGLPSTALVSQASVSVSPTISTSTVSTSSSIEMGPALLMMQPPSFPSSPSFDYSSSSSNVYVTAEQTYWQHPNASSDAGNSLTYSPLNAFPDLISGLESFNSSPTSNHTVDNSTYGTCAPYGTWSPWDTVINIT